MYSLYTASNIRPPPFHLDRHIDPLIQIPKSDPMPATPPAMLPSFAGGSNSIGGDDEDFGDFVFSSPSSSSHAPTFFPYPNPTFLSTTSANDEDWGDFVASELGSHSLQPQSSSPFSPPFDSSPPSSKSWVKPKGAIPLSIFGEEEGEGADLATLEASGSFENGFGSYSFSTQSSSRPATSGKLNDLIEELYGQIDVSGKEDGDDLDDGSWEFKDAFSADARIKMNGGGDTLFGLEMLMAANENGRSQIILGGSQGKHMDFLTSHSMNIISAPCSQHKQHVNNRCINSYDSIKTRLENGWKGMEQINMGGQEGGLLDIFPAPEKLTNMSLGHNHSVTDKVLHEMLPSFGNGTSGNRRNGFKIEFPENGIINGFTEKIQYDQADLLHAPANQEAEKYLNDAVDLFTHSSVLQILRLASREQQLSYIKAWCKLASACTKELQLGAKIWTESLDCNISKQILTQGNKYFLALGEVYRVSKILQATVRFYMPWLQSNLEDSNEIFTCLEKGNKAWINSGLEESLQSISSSNMDLDDKGLAKLLVESINLIDKVNEQTCQGTAILQKNGVCRFSLLPLDKLPGIKTVFWNGDCYIAKIANFWANRISPDPPQIPSIMPCL